jgi:hypothetical protein
MAIEPVQDAVSSVDAPAVTAALALLLLRFVYVAGPRRS